MYKTSYMKLKANCRKIRTWHINRAKCTRDLEIIRKRQETHRKMGKGYQYTQEDA